MASSDVVLDVRDLHTYFFNRRGVTKAVDGVSFTLREGETLGIVGESGCGKTMTARSLLRIIPKPAARIVSGDVILDGENLVELSDEEMRHVRGSKIAMIFRNPTDSFEPRVHHRQPGYRGPGHSPEGPQPEPGREGRGCPEERASGRSGTQDA